MKNITKKLTTLGITAAILTCGLVICMGSTKTEASDAGNEVFVEADPYITEPEGMGSWKAAESTEMTEELKKIFEEAISTLCGYSYSPAALLATQTVAGTNYCFLTYSSGDMKLAYINVDPAGKASFISDKELPLPGFSSLGTKLGGWTYAQDPAITSAIRDLIDKASETLTGAIYEPVAYLGSQVVSGRNHAVLCKMTPSVPELNGKASYVIVYVYEDVQGNCEITETTTVEFDIG